jgi:hypothetical protein
LCTRHAAPTLLAQQVDHVDASGLNRGSFLHESFFHDFCLNHSRLPFESSTTIV